MKVVYSRSPQSIQAASPRLQSVRCVVSSFDFGTFTMPVCLAAKFFQAPLPLPIPEFVLSAIGRYLCVFSNFPLKISNCLGAVEKILLTILSRWYEYTSRR